MATDVVEAGYSHMHSTRHTSHSTRHTSHNALHNFHTNSTHNHGTSATGRSDRWRTVPSQKTRYRHSRTVISTSISTSINITLHRMRRRHRCQPDRLPPRQQQSQAQPQAQPQLQTQAETAVRRPAHHALVEQHEKKKRLEDLRRQAAAHASTCLGHFTDVSSYYGNFILPSLPRPASSSS
ncbi:hypothetical protein PTSG_09019 [Salpingoeca rosetta]|uniref:Uncharacterized protein n=1 Tax=Salpingoeca rosetta (strain ATCC 50818 / BSB-021) TaxID=946362 RepID=F2ULZ4_SALR5|nr:uncharacterized protein PTSG_09019 [Salpingoeca rosetta]EGD78143.1 hypothetical protein PTSG_09019 [Salpingoeca rosetta]|eukprot:XP_004989819.1 hypothetical protein PTSG_09019 [Salpingoeca rosetta]